MIDIVKELDKYSKPHEGDTYNYDGVDFPKFGFSNNCKPSH